MTFCLQTAVLQQILLRIDARYHVAVVEDEIIVVGVDRFAVEELAQQIGGLVEVVAHGEARGLGSSVERADAIWLMAQDVAAVGRTVQYAYASLIRQHGALEYAVAVFGAGFEPRDRYAVQASYGAASVYRLVVLGTFDVVEVSAVVGGYLDPRYGVDIGLPYDGKFVLSAGLYVRPLRYDGLFLRAEHGRQRDRQDQQ